jgi:hypothetical protein
MQAESHNIGKEQSIAGQPQQQQHAHRKHCSKRQTTRATAEKEQNTKDNADQ